MSNRIRNSSAVSSIDYWFVAIPVDASIRWSMRMWIERCLLLCCCWDFLGTVSLGGPSRPGRRGWLCRSSLWCLGAVELGSGAEGGTWLAVLVSRRSIANRVREHITFRRK